MTSLIERSSRCSGCTATSTSRAGSAGSAGRSRSTPAATTGPGPSTARSSRSSATRSRPTSWSGAERWRRVPRRGAASSRSTSGRPARGRRPSTSTGAACSRPAAPTRRRSPRPGWAEQDGRAWRSAALGALGRARPALGPAARRAGGRPGDRADRAVPVGRPRRRARRAGPAGPDLPRQPGHGRGGGDPRAVRRRGDPRADRPPAVGLPHRPEAALAARARAGGRSPGRPLALQPRDLVALALTGEAATDGTHAAATLVYDLRAGRWDRGLARRPRPRPGALPADPRRRARSSAGCGRRSPRGSGCRPALPVVLGGADSQACALGAGVVAPGPVSEMAGSSTCLNAAVPSRSTSSRVTHYPHVVPGRTRPRPGSTRPARPSPGSPARLYGGRPGRPTAADYARLDAEAARGPAGRGRRPRPAGPRRRRADRPGPARGRHRPVAPPRAGAPWPGRSSRASPSRSPTSSSCSGPAARPSTSCASRAATPASRPGPGSRPTSSGIPVRTIPGDAAVTGVAMLAGLGAGVYRDPAEAIARCVRLEPPIEPDPRPRRLCRRAPPTRAGAARGPRGVAPVVAARPEEADDARPARDQHLLRGQALAARRRTGRRSSATGSACARPALVRPVAGRRLDARREAPVRRDRRPPRARAPLDVHRAGGLLGQPAAPSRRRPARAAAAAWFGWAIDWTAAAGGRGDRRARRRVQRRRLDRPGAPRARAGRDLRASLDAPGGAARARRARVPPGREPGRRPRAVDDGDDPRPADRRRRRPRPDPALPRRRPHVRARARAATTATRTPGCASSAGPAPVVQLQQSDADGDHHWPFTAERNADGRIDADRVLDALGEGGVEETRPRPRGDPAVRAGRRRRSLDDLVASVDLLARGARPGGLGDGAEPTLDARVSAGPPRASRTSGRARRPGPAPSSRAIFGRAVDRRQERADLGRRRRMGRIRRPASSATSSAIGPEVALDRVAEAPVRPEHDRIRTRSIGAGAPSRPGAADARPTLASGWSASRQAASPRSFAVHLPDLELGQQQVGQVEGQAVGRQAILELDRVGHRQPVDDDVDRPAPVGARVDQPLGAVDRVEQLVADVALGLEEPPERPRRPWPWATRSKSRYSRSYGGRAALGDWIRIARPPMSRTRSRRPRRRPTIRRASASISARCGTVGPGRPAAGSWPVSLAIGVDRRRQSGRGVGQDRRPVARDDPPDRCRRRRAAGSGRPALLRAGSPSGGRTSVGRSVSASPAMSVPSAVRKARWSGRWPGVARAVIGPSPVPTVAPSPISVAGHDSGGRAARARRGSARPSACGGPPSRRRDRGRRG